MPKRRSTKIPQPTVTAWSASRIFEFELCPQKFAFGQDRSLPTPEPGPPLVLGKRVHAEGEAYLKGLVSEVPEFYRYFEKELRALKRAKAVAEGQWAFTRDWMPCEWYAPETWCRMMVDAHVEKKRSVRIVDFKTGGQYLKDEEQCGLYALGAFKRFPRVRTVIAELWYLKTDSDVIMEFDRSEEPELQEHWEARAAALLEATEWPAKPNPGRWPCAHCGFSKTQGGPCTHG